MNLKQLLNNCKNCDKIKIDARFNKSINPSSISYEGMQLLKLIVNKINPKVTLEFGSGLSTLFLSSIISKKSLFISVDDSVEYLQKTRKILGNVRTNTILHLAPISTLQFKFKYFMSYKLSYLKLLNENKLDLVFIDGPLGYKYGREFSIYALIPYITNKTIFILDDSDRTGEQKALFNWHKVFTDGLEIIHIKQIKYGMTVFRITNPKHISLFPFSISEIIKSIINIKIKKIA